MKTLITTAAAALFATASFADTPGTPGIDWTLIRTNVTCSDGNQVNVARLQRGSIINLVEAGTSCPGQTTVEMPVGLHPFELAEVNLAIEELFGAVETAPVLQRAACDTKLLGVCIERDHLQHGDRF